MKKTTLIALILTLLFYGCGTKRQYFEPEKLDGSIKSTNALQSKIQEATLFGATLNDGSIITKDGVNTAIKIKDGFKFLGEYKGLYISADMYGMLEVTDNSNNLVFSRKFQTAVVSASLESNLLAVVTSLNEIQLIDIYTAQILMQYKSSEIFSVDSRVASPIFLTYLIIYPTLDGRIYIVHKNGQIIKDIVISSETFFNNIIFLDVVNDTMIAATAKKAMIIDPQNTYYFNAEIKNVLRKDDRIFIFTKDGTIFKTDFEFTKLAEMYFKFAIFSNATIVNNKLYVIEKTGYVIQTDLDLTKSDIYKMSSDIGLKSFMGKDGFYNNKEFIKLD